MYEPSRQIMSFFVAGFQYWDGALALGGLKVGDALDLAAEPDNPHDGSAVALRHEGLKLGYVPRDRNELLATAMFYGHADAFEARVLQVDEKAEPWKQLRVGIFLEDVR